MDLLQCTAHLPEQRLAAGEALVTEGGRGHAMWVLVEGALAVVKGDITVNTIDRPGSLVGEISVLLGVPYTATVRATVASRLRVAEDGQALLDGDPAVARLVAAGLAERLNVVTTYLADLKRQYAGAPGLAMVSDVLAQLSAHPGPAPRPGSVRDTLPDAVE